MTTDEAMERIMAMPDEEFLKIVGDDDSDDGLLSALGYLTGGGGQ